jgi:hypothetical protein
MEPPTGFMIQESSIDGLPAIQLVAPSEDGREVVLRDTLTEGPSTRSVLIGKVLELEPGLGIQRASKWVDNQLQTMKKAGEVRTERRGQWSLA